MLTPRQELVLRQGRRGLPRRRRARRLQDDRRRPRVRLAARRRSATSWPCLEELRPARPSAHLGRPRAHRGRPPLLRRPPARPAARSRPQPGAGALADPPRGRRGDAGDHRDPLAGDQPAGDRLRAVDRHRDDPPRRGARAAAAGADGRGHHLDRRGLQAPVHLRRGRSTPAWPTGPPSYLNERLVGLGLGARMLHQRLDRPVACRRPSARSSSALAPAFPELEARSAGRRCTSTARPACSSRPA